MHHLSTRATEELRHLIDTGGTWPSQLADGEICIICASMPGRSVIGIDRRDGVLSIIIDTDKPDARRHLAELIANWPLGPEAAHAQWKTGDILELLTPLLLGEVEDGGPRIIRQEVV